MATKGKLEVVADANALFSREFVKVTFLEFLFLCIQIISWKPILYYVFFKIIILKILLTLLLAKLLAHFYPLKFKLILTDLVFQAVFSEKGNLVTSPLSCLLTLAMAHVGADGETAQCLSKALFLPIDITSACQGFKELVENLTVSEI